MSESKIDIEFMGSGGIVHYAEGENHADFWWELGGGDVVAIISGPPPQAWDHVLPWAIGRRREILLRIASEVETTQSLRAVAELADGDTSVVLRRKSP